MTLHDLVVLGGGPAGVGAAFRAGRAGRDVVLLERAPILGGAAASTEVAGLRVDHGSHRLHPSVDPAIRRDLEALLGADLQRRERRGRIRLGGRWIAFPLEAADAMTSLPPGFAARAALDAVTAPFRRPDEDTFAERIRAGLGPTMLERFYGPYAEKLWGLPPEEIDGEQARRRVSAGSVGSLVARLVGRRDGAGRGFLYPRRGFGQISEALGAAAADQGADLRLGTTAVGLRAEPDRIVVETDGAAFAGRRVWSTIPLPVLVRLWRGAPESLLRHARALETRAMVLTYLVLDIPRYTRFDAHYLPERWTPVTRISEPKNYRDSHDDPADRTVLCAELPCAVGDKLWTADEAQLRRIVLDALATANLPAPPVVGVEVRRLPSAYPVYRRGYATHADALEAWAGGVERLLTFGRQGLFVHDNSHHALAMAYAAADALGPDGAFDRAAWRAARQRFRSHTVED